MRCLSVTLITLLWMVSGALADAAGPARVRESLRPGAFLFSSPQLRDPNFLHTVVLLVTYEKEGALGLIINRPTDVPLNEALPNVDGIEKLSKPIYFGGPVNTNLMLALLRSTMAPSGARKVLEDVYFTVDRKALIDALQNQTPDKKIRIYAGYSGWGPEQLDREFARGDWVIMEADPESVFSEDPSRIWPAFFENQGKIQIRENPPARPLQGDQTVSPGTVEQ